MTKRREVAATTSGDTSLMSIAEIDDRGDFTANTLATVGTAGPAA
jgi:hypothetical protein